MKPARREEEEDDEAALMLPGALELNIQHSCGIFPLSKFHEVHDEILVSILFRHFVLSCKM